MDFIESCGHERLPFPEFVLPSPYLNLLLYPKPLQFKRRKPLDPQKFVRIHRGTIVNVDRVARLSPLGHGDQVVVLKDGRKLTASRRYREGLERLLEPL